MLLSIAINLVYGWKNEEENVLGRFRLGHVVGFDVTEYNLTQLK